MMQFPNNDHRIMPLKSNWGSELATWLSQSLRGNESLGIEIVVFLSNIYSVFKQPDGCWLILLSTLSYFIVAIASTEKKPNYQWKIHFYEWFILTRQVTTSDNIPIESCCVDLQQSLYKVAQVDAIATTELISKKINKCKFSLLYIFTRLWMHYLDILHNVFLLRVTVLYRLCLKFL